MTAPRGLSKKPEAPTMPTPRCIKFNLEKPDPQIRSWSKRFNSTRWILNSLHIFRGVPLFWGGIAHCVPKSLSKKQLFFFAARQQKHLFWNPLQSAQSCHLPRSKFRTNFVVQLQNRGSCQDGDTIFRSFCCYCTLVVP